MNLFADLADICTPRASLARRTWFGIGGPADYFLQPRSVEQLAAVIRRCHDSGTPLRFLGLGANVLVPDEGVRGAVLHLSDAAFTSVAFDGSRAVAGAGADMTLLVKSAVKHGLAGLEQLAGIPGSVGGGVAMNCGGRYGDIASALESITVITPAGEVVVRRPADLAFGYRHCALGEDCVVQARFALREVDPAALNARYHDIFNYKKATQPPLGENSVGCIFRNPPGQSAGRLIDLAGLKGERVGSAWVSDRHANFILSREGGRAADVLELIRRVQARVADHAGIILQPEVRIWADEYEQAAASRPIARAASVAVAAAGPATGG